MDIHTSLVVEFPATNPMTYFDKVIMFMTSLGDYNLKSYRKIHELSL